MVFNPNQEVQQPKDRTVDNDNTLDARTQSRLQSSSMGDREAILKKIDKSSRQSDTSEHPEVTEAHKELNKGIELAQQQFAAIAQSLGVLLSSAPPETLNQVIDGGAGIYHPELMAMLQDAAQLHPENQKNSTVVKTEATLNDPKDPRVAQLVMDHFKHVTDELMT